VSIEFAITKRGKVGGMKLVANVKVTENVIEFETHDKNVTFYWSLTVQKSRNRGLLHGSCREMLIDERVRKQHWHLDECYGDFATTIRRTGS
jgi:hypothetical protein